MSASTARSGRIGLLVAISIIALLIAGGALILAINPPFQGPQSSPSPTASESSTPTATATSTPTASTSQTPTPTPSPTDSATPTPTPTVTPTTDPIPTADPVPDDESFHTVVDPILTDASTGLDMITESVAADNFSDAQAIITQLANDVQRLLDNPKPSDPGTWNGAVQTYSSAINNLSQALGNADADRTATALDAAHRDLGNLVELAK